jgi:hypothetical protein
MSSWSGGFAEWDEGDTTYLSIAFTWLLDRAAGRAMVAKALGKRVVAGGPALFLASMRHEIVEFAEVRDTYPDAIARHNAGATIASRGCPVGCGFCIVPAMEGRDFTLLPDFPVRPILCDNNLSALPGDYQDFIVRRYLETGVPLRDANSGFEPMTFTRQVYERWRPLLNAGGGPWRFAYDEMRERDVVIEVMRMLHDEPPRRKRVYVLIGNEPVSECMSRIAETIAMRCEPHVQPVMKLNALDRRPWVRHDWTERKLRDVARWANGRLWRQMSFDEYDRHARKRPEKYNAQEGLFA